MEEVELEEGDASAKPSEEYASDDCDDDVWSLSPHSNEFFEDLWLSERGRRESCVRSEGREKADSRSSSKKSGEEDWAGGAGGFGRTETLIVDTPSSSSSSSSK